MFFRLFGRAPDRISLLEMGGELFCYALWISTLSARIYQRISNGEHLFLLWEK